MPDSPRNRYVGDSSATCWKDRTSNLLISQARRRILGVKRQSLNFGQPQTCPKLPCAKVGALGSNRELDLMTMPDTELGHSQRQRGRPCALDPEMCQFPETSALAASLWPTPSAVHPGTPASRGRLEVHPHFLL